MLHENPAHGILAPHNKNLFFGPLYSFWKIINNKYWCFWRLGRTSTHLITVFYHLANGCSNFELWEEWKLLIILKAMQMMLQTSAQSIFAVLGWQTCGFFFYLFFDFLIFPVPQLLLRTGAFPYVYIFIRIALNGPKFGSLFL